MSFSGAGTDMQKVTLYGRSAAIFHLGKDTFRAENGVVSLPAQLVPNALAMGFRRQPLDGADDLAKIELPESGEIEAGEPLSTGTINGPHVEGLPTTDMCFEPAQPAPAASTQLQGEVISPPHSRAGPHGDPFALRG